jgi:hypothetical protein
VGLIEEDLSNKKKMLTEISTFLTQIKTAIEKQKA